MLGFQEQQYLQIFIESTFQAGHITPCIVSNNYRLVNY